MLCLPTRGQSAWVEQEHRQEMEQMSAHVPGARGNGEHSAPAWHSNQALFLSLAALDAWCPPYTQCLPGSQEMQPREMPLLLTQLLLG